MSLGSRIAKGGRVAIVASLVSAPREPLLFFYPQWARSSSTAPARRSINDSSTTTPSSTEKDLPAKVYYNSELPKQPSNGRTLHNRSIARRDEAATKTPSNEALLKDITFPSSEPIVVPTPSSTLADVQRIVRRVLRAAERTNISERTAHSIRVEFQEFRRHQTDNWVPDWRVVLDDLLKHTPHHGQWSDRQIQVVVSSSATEQLLSGLDDYIWDLGNQYGCSISLGPGTQSKDHRHGTFILSGSKTGISKTIVDVLRVAPDAKIMTTENLYSSSLGLQPTSPDTVSGVKVRSVVSKSRAKEGPTTPDKIQQPTTWTQASLLEYVRALTSIELPFKSGSTYFELTLRMLRELFMDPDPSRRAAITRTACNEALQYFVKVNHMEDVRVLFVRMELLHLRLTPETFNIMLRGAAKQEDLHNFHFILHLMLKRGLVPNGDTWTAFMMALPDFETKVHVARAMKHAGLLQHQSTMKAVCEQLIDQEIEISLDANQDQEALVSHMDARYGRDWLTLDSAGRVLDGLGSRGLISRCWDFLHFMDSRFVRPNKFHINTMLNHCKQTANLDGAVELMQHINPSWNYQPDSETFRILFSMAWNGRNYNVAKVVWKYGCLSGNTNYQMRRIVCNSMLSAWTLPNTPRQRWACSAGWVIFGSWHTIESHPVAVISEFAKSVKLENSEKYSFEKTVPGQLSLVPPNMTPKYKPLRYVYPYKGKDVRNIKEKEFEKAMGKLKTIFKLDVQINSLAAPVTTDRSFQEMLARAWQLDQNWRKEGHYRDGSLKWLMDNAIRVLLIAKAPGEVLRIST